MTQTEYVKIGLAIALLAILLVWRRLDRYHERMQKRKGAKQRNIFDRAES